jgi:hypothetical protein
LFVGRATGRAAASSDTVCVRLDHGGLGYVCEQTGASGTTIVDSGEFESPCATNYPNATVEFRLPGWPCTLSGEPRAGSFVFACHGAESSVVLQMGGRIRWS